MARRRMFSLDIIDTDVFIDMPVSTQNLYFHLAMRADDDGFVSSPKKIIKTVNAADDDYKVLLAKKFLIPFDTGICVITHWRIHNYIQSDRYKPSLYTNEKKMLIADTNGTYRLDTKCIQDGYKPDTQVRLGEVRLGKDKEEKSALETTLPDPLYQAIFQSFIGKAGAFTNYPKEAEAIKRIIKYCAQHSKKYADGDPAIMAEIVITKFYELTQNGDKFWRGQPFTPSRLSSVGIFDSLLVELGANTESETGNEIPF